MVLRLYRVPALHNVEQSLDNQHKQIEEIYGEVNDYGYRHQPPLTLRAPFLQSAVNSIFSFWVYYTRCSQLRVNPLYRKLLLCVIGVNFPLWGCFTCTFAVPFSANE